MVRKNNNTQLCQAILCGWCEDKIPGAGEDAALHLDATGSIPALIACMDGCGASGAKRHILFNTPCKESRVASHEIKEALREYYRQLCTQKVLLPDELPIALKHCIDTRLQMVSEELEKLSSSRSSIKNRLAKPLPSTLAMILAKAVGDVVTATTIWAGDSRCYALLPNGMLQLSIDDTIEGAAQRASMNSDASVTNVINQKGNYRLHCTEYRFLSKRKAGKLEPCILLTVSDGCYGYFALPYLLEGVLLDALMDEHVVTPDQWLDLVKERIMAVASDDASLQVVGFCDETESAFSELKEWFRPRWEYFHATFDKPLTVALQLNDTQIMANLWDQYINEMEMISQQVVQDAINFDGIK